MFQVSDWRTLKEYFSLLLPKAFFLMPIESDVGEGRAWGRSTGTAVMASHHQTA